MRAVVLESDVQNVVKNIRDGVRLDGRALEEFRPITVEKDMCKNAEGSVIITMGKTQVIGGLKMIVGVPYPDNQDSGSIAIGAEALPLAHAEYESGRPSDSEVEIARVVDRGLRESKAIDFKSLCIKEGEAVWVGFFDFYALNGDGNLFDAGSIAALLTFYEGKMPKLDKDNKIIKNEFAGKIKLKRYPLLTTFVKIAGKIMIDPTYMEEKAAEARYSVATTNDGFMTAMQKGIGGSFTLDEVKYMQGLAFKTADKIRKDLKIK